MQAYRDRGAAEGDAGMQAKADETYTAGDINTSLIQTARGRTVMLQHDVVSPRPCAQPTHPASAWLPNLRRVSQTRGTTWSPARRVPSLISRRASSSTRERRAR